MTTAHWHIHICVGTGRRYQARAHSSGAKRYVLLGKATKSLRIAFRRASDAILSGGYNRTDVLLMADYYDPMQVYEIRRR